MIDKESTFPIIIAGIFVMVAIIAATIVHCSYQGVYEIDMFNTDGTIAKTILTDGAPRYDTVRGSISYIEKDSRVSYNIPCDKPVLITKISD